MYTCNTIMITVLYTYPTSAYICCFIYGYLHGEWCHYQSKASITNIGFGNSDRAHEAPYADCCEDARFANGLVAASSTIAKDGTRQAWEALLADQTWPVPPVHQPMFAAAAAFIQEGSS